MDGDAWTVCAAGHRHWGRFGAAGLFLVADDAVLLQRRADWSHHGGTWGVPGGALAQAETPRAGAVREAREEAAGIDPGLVELVADYVDDHGGWSYTTVLARAGRQFGVRPAGLETAELAWAPLCALRRYDLHPGFAATLPNVLELWRVAVGPITARH